MNNIEYNEYNLNHIDVELLYIELLYIFAILLGIWILISMSSNLSGYNQVYNQPSLTDDKSNDKYRLTFKLNCQLLYNNIQPSRGWLTYNRFPENHQGHLTFEDRKNLVDILSSSDLESKYRFGSSLGTIYIKDTNNYPVTDPNMIAVVMVAESQKGERS